MSFIRFVKYKYYSLRWTATVKIWLSQVVYILSSIDKLYTIYGHWPCLFCFAALNFFWIWINFIFDLNLSYIKGDTLKHTPIFRIRVAHHWFDILVEHINWDSTVESKLLRRKRWRDKSKIYSRSSVNCAVCFSTQKCKQCLFLKITLWIAFLSLESLSCK